MSGNTLIAPVLRTLRTWHDRAEQRRQLAGMDGHLLRDIGLDRRTAEAEIAKPFWRG